MSLAETAAATSPGAITGLGAGLAVLGLRSRGRLIGFAVLGVSTQVVRNWLMVWAVGVDVSILDAMALLIVIFTVGQLPIGPSTGPAATVLILGSHGLAAAAAAGVLVTVTGIVGSLLFAVWAALAGLGDARRSRILARAAPAAPTVGGD